MLVCVICAFFVYTNIYVTDDKFITHFFHRQIYHHSFAFNKLTNCFNVLKPTLWKVDIISLYKYTNIIVYMEYIWDLAYRII